MGGCGMKPLRILECGTLVAVLAASVLVTGCGGAGSSSSGPGTPPGPLSVSLSTSTVVAPQDGTPGTVDVTVSGANTGSSVSVAASNLPSSVTSQFAPAAGGVHGTLSLVAGSTAPAGTYSASVVVTNGTQTASQSFVLVIAIVASIGNSVDTTLGVGGKLEQFMSTSFQPSEGDYQFFRNHTATEPSLLKKLVPQHIPLQGLSQAVPMKANQELGTRADPKNVPIWVTENNVKADYDNGNGMSNCIPTQKFVLDPRGTSAFFGAWRPYVFSQLGKAGNQALYHWVYGADTQSGEVDFSTGSTYLSFSVDYWLGQMFPSTPGFPGPDILQLVVTETSRAEILGTKNSDGSVVVMVVDRAVHASTDNKWHGRSTNGDCGCFGFGDVLWRDVDND